MKGFLHEPFCLWLISSDILSDISFDTLSDISSDTSSDILSDISFDISSDILSDISFDILSDTFRGWGPARNTGLTGSRLRSGAEHWTHRIAVEVRRGTLASQDHGWGSARNTDHTSSQEETEDETKEEAEEEEDKADIKSNNPHLTGGEKKPTSGDGNIGNRTTNQLSSVNLELDTLLRSPLIWLMISAFSPHFQGRKETLGRWDGCHTSTPTVLWWWPDYIAAFFEIFWGSKPFLEFFSLPVERWSRFWALPLLAFVSLI